MDPPEQATDPLHRELVVDHAHDPGKLDLGRGLGLLPDGRPPPAVTAVLLTPGDGRADWLAAGQALHRLLAHAASKWVFASLHTQPLEAAAIRTLIRHRLRSPAPRNCCCNWTSPTPPAPPRGGRPLT